MGLLTHTHTQAHGDLHIHIHTLPLTGEWLATSRAIPDVVGVRGGFCVFIPLIGVYICIEQ